MSFDGIVEWAGQLGLETDYDEETQAFRFRSVSEVLRFGERAPQIDTEWMSHFEAEEFLQSLEVELENQPE